MKHRVKEMHDPRVPSVGASDPDAYAAGGKLDGLAGSESHLLDVAVHAALGLEDPKASPTLRIKLYPNYSGDDAIALDALARLRKKGRLFTGCYFGDLAKATYPDKVEPFDCHLTRDRSANKDANPLLVVVQRSGPTLAIAICRAIRELDRVRKESKVW